MAKKIKQSKQGVLALLSISEWEFVSNMEKIRKTRHSNKALAIEVMAERYPDSLDMHELLDGMKEKGAIFASKAPLRALGVMMTQYEHTFVRTEGKKGCRGSWTVMPHLREKEKTISKKTLEMCDESAKNFKEGAVSEAIDIDGAMECSLKMSLISVMQDGSIVMTVGEITRGVFIDDSDAFGTQSVAPAEQVRKILNDGNGVDFFKLKDDGKTKWRLSKKYKGE